MRVRRTLAATVAVPLALLALLGVVLATGASCRTASMEPSPECDSVTTRCERFCTSTCDSRGCFPSCYEQCWQQCEVDPDKPLSDAAAQRDPNAPEAAAADAAGADAAEVGVPEGSAPGGALD